MALFRVRVNLNYDFAFEISNENGKVWSKLNRNIPSKYNSQLLLSRFSFGVLQMKTDNISNCETIVYDAWKSIYKNGEDLNDLNKLRPGELKHVHLARPNPDRDAPIKEDYNVLMVWANKLREIGYTGRVSLECLWKYGFENSVKEAGEQMKVFCQG